ncbi:hypothetical protein KEM54_004628 [Ascosphaera aggregata]|nr:hypothetical protein KEM54_004628 [Ascosphaera aggregata]
MPSSTDILDGLLRLEDEFYEEGFRVGTHDGTRAGYEEGNVFAVEKGYEKFVEMGQLYGKAIIWAKRLPGSHLVLDKESSSCTAAEKISEESTVSEPQLQSPVKCSGNPRLEKHIAQLLHLVDPTSLSYENTEEGVNEFDDRLKRAAAKAKLIERILGELNYEETEVKASGGTGNIEDIGNIPPRLLSRLD